MPDCFVSYANEDLELAQAVQSVLEARSVDVFIASVSLKPGDNWGEQIRRNLLNSRCVLFLASKRACKSPFVQQELGMAIGAAKKVIPVVWDISPSELPGWIGQSQAIDLTHGSMADLNEKIDEVAKNIQMEKFGSMLLMVSGALAALILFNPDKQS